MAATTCHLKPVVVKLGSSTLLDASGALDTGYLAGFAADVAALVEAGYAPVVVSSGAIACGVKALGLDARPTDMPSLQACASVGQSVLAKAYEDVFAPYGLRSSTVLLTRHDTKERTSYLHARDALSRLISYGVVPIVNENDTVSVDEIRFGDNDTLAAIVACLVQAASCVIFSDVEGLFDADPRTHADAKIIPQVDEIDEAMLASAGGAGSSVGSGGMVTKLGAARVLMAAGIPLLICHGRRPHALTDFVAGRPVGTVFSSSAKRHEMTARKLWVALGDAPHGSVTVDDGAREALVARGSSLLPVGVTSLSGAFASGDVVDVRDSSGRTFARGLIRASSDELALARGRDSHELASNALLRHLARRALIHRDDMVVYV